ncbi:3' terminal RNA ribose 2'-O-methyltransferase Hen1 [Paenactinomyces guangxiensis]|uniref:Small RNA 2'-O-methyltransferase n=1 Tax=Paenactinomyces guangxiensis TaxID=1490290 RepID=A0A7W2A8N3_9BACL|nr:3' terminal RNA ribose 2'-O-methyltransferase Hen1 [Paenactinomyces guangxiensis]MBA4494810.1 3' terminal RNA ribose 2'-O-methyltransferase Hen1 [Paenactinomyces guangxiensis]MBH8591893.1 3' terminal RNA ribose 2'-O-methyltransferase Hen1 [Paenactinomyces guangxiensis]
MLLTITYQGWPATDLGYLLHKNPQRVQTFSLSYGEAHVFYPEVSEERCTAALVLDIDPVGLVRGRKKGANEGFTMEQYVNDRPYVASSFLSVAIARVFGTALAGRSKERPGLVEQKLPLEAHLSVIPCRGGEQMLRRLFEPLGYELEMEAGLLDDQFPDWGISPYYSVTIRGDVRLKDLLSHLYVLIPVLDNEKHYWVGEDELKKLLRHGEEWLSEHPERELIATRYLKYRRKLARTAMERLMDQETAVTGEEEQKEEQEAGIEKPLSLNEQRLQAVSRTLIGSGATRILDLGCGEGKLIRLLMKERQVKEIVGMDVSARALMIAQERLHLDCLSSAQAERVQLIQGSLLYRDERLSGFEAAAMVEVIEHLEPNRLKSFERVLFEFAKPGTVVLTTPNVEYNAKFENLRAGKFRHSDHRFEWTRLQFQEWANRVADEHGYSVSFAPIGPVDEQVGPPTQMAVFTQIS